MWERYYLAKLNGEIVCDKRESERVIGQNRQGDKGLINLIVVATAEEIGLVESVRVEIVEAILNGAR